MDAIEEIHKDLRSLKQRRALAVVTYAGLMLLFFGALLLKPKGAEALTRDPSWGVAFGLLLTGSLLGAAMTIGYPLVRRSVFYGASGVIVAGAVGALALTMSPDADASPVGAGVRCFAFGTGVSAVAMAVLGALSGRLWRRFPDPGFVMALGMTGVGLAVLHLHCGGVDPVHLFVFHLGPLAVVYGLAHFAVRAKNAVAHE